MKICSICNQTLKDDAIECFLCGNKDLASLGESIQAVESIQSLMDEVNRLLEVNRYGQALKKAHKLRKKIFEEKGDYSKNESRAIDKTIRELEDYIRAEKRAQMPNRGLGSQLYQSEQAKIPCTDRP